MIARKKVQHCNGSHSKLIPGFITCFTYIELQILRNTYQSNVFEFNSKITNTKQHYYNTGRIKLLE